METQPKADQPDYLVEALNAVAEEGERKGYEFQGFYIPARMMGAIERYVEYAAIPGDFLQAVICNDLKEALGRADDENMKNLPAYVAFFYNETPSLCWGSPKKMKAWCDSKQEQG